MEVVPLEAQGPGGDDEGPVLPEDQEHLLPGDGGDGDPDGALPAPMLPAPMDAPPTPGQAVEPLGGGQDGDEGQGYSDDGLDGEGEEGNIAGDIGNTDGVQVGATSLDVCLTGSFQILLIRF